ncbi:TlpA family protein disulfide reductase [Massilia antarctica]|uniref:TlpA family protein disulfide reductase n=1 Tax=Massilia antarctica TaxID=2765360 RepID=A0AA48WHL9_9BURK|nr:MULTISPECIES: TlpA disulfide reductase family protein [Massilia]MCY0915741.1 TlpA disulfide reductase family protein [Massilia sp. H27-R4]QPI51340.1 TlpA family protein disulfide reductase [Massilia antarctica]CUI06217.1 Cytochrome c-type biogenesis protein ResA [Janthinobacterium sp. CG23_2]CUU30003.1 Cytochrome c-type biogenesis protein ResA [Janthinobacterium sp. CG23_2]
MSTHTPPRSSWLKPALIGAAVLAIAGAGYVALTRGTPAPDVTFIDIKGQKISSQSLRGKVVMVNFWATSCATCVKEMPQMVATYNKFKGAGMEFIAVAMKYDPPNYVLSYTETRQLPFTVALDSAGDLAKAFGDVALTPTTFVIDKDGKIIKRYVGEPDFPALHQLLQKTISG